MDVGLYVYLSAVLALLAGASATANVSSPLVLSKS